MQKGEQEKAEEIISSVVTLMLELADRGVRDRDCVIRRNIGLYEGHAIFIDLGGFARTENADHRSINKPLTKFHLWLENNYPELIRHLDSVSLQVQ